MYVFFERDWGLPSIPQDSAQCLKHSKVKKKVTRTFTILSSADKDASS